MNTRPELIRKWHRSKFTLTLYDLHKSDDYGKSILAYKFYCNKELIFADDDFHLSPLHAIDSDNAIYSLLGFLSLQIGDTDKEYFDNYTERQLQFTNSQDCEELAMLVYDFENL